MEEILDNFDQLCFDHSLITIKNKILNNERLGFKEAEIIMETRDLNSLGVLAKYKKFLKDGRKIYFVVNRHINPTNICAISWDVRGHPFNLHDMYNDADLIPSRFNPRNIFCSDISLCIVIALSMNILGIPAF